MPKKIVRWQNKQQTRKDVWWETPVGQFKEMVKHIPNGIDQLIIESGMEHLTKNVKKPPEAKEEK